MKRWKLTVLAGALALGTLLASCGAGNGTSGGTGSTDPVDTTPPATDPTSAYQKITAEEAKSKMDGGGVVVVDVRRADEYEAGHIPGAINLPNEDIAETQPAALPELDATLLVYCRTGVRSKQASDKLVKLGYTHVNDMGGIVDWPYETVTGSEPGTYVASESATPEEEATPGLLSTFSTTDLDGNAVDASVLENANLTMVNVWTTYCGYCLDEMPALGELAEEYADKGVQIIGLVADVVDMNGSLSDSQVKKAKEIVETTKAKYLHLLPSADFNGILSQVVGVPTTFFVDSQGKQVGNVYATAMSKDKWAKVLDETLTEVSP